MKLDQINGYKIAAPNIVQLIISILGWAVTLSVVLLAEWNTLPTLLRIVIISFISISCMVSLVLGLIPAIKRIKQSLHKSVARRRQRKILSKFAELLIEMGLLLDLNRTSSLRNYIYSIRNDSANSNELSNRIRNLSDRLNILANWHWSLLTLSNTKFRDSESIINEIRNIVRFYRDVADIVREFTNIKSEDRVSVQFRSDSGIMAQNKYNQHIDRVEGLLSEARKINPEFTSGDFYRFN